MIYAYAIDPECVVEWAKDRLACCLVNVSFGLGTPRVLFELPNTNDWIAAIDEASKTAELTDGQESQLTELISVLTEAVARRPAGTYDANVSWKDNALQALVNCGLQAIITINPGEAGTMSCADIGDDRNSLWSRPSAETPRRTVTDLGNALGPLLRHATEIHFIDPHIGFEMSRYRRPFEVYFAHLDGCLSIVLHCRVKATLQSFQNEAQKMCPQIPTGLVIRFRRWDSIGGRNDEELHERYVLTDIGGVAVPPGLDSGKGSANFNILSAEQYRRRLSEYVGQRPAFVLVDQPADITGTKP